MEKNIENDPLIRFMLRTNSNRFSITLNNEDNLEKKLWEISHNYFITIYCKVLNLGG